MLQKLFTLCAAFLFSKPYSYAQFTTPRTQLAYKYLKTLPHKKRKFENQNSIIHSLRIAENFTDESLIIISLFHDVLEDFGQREEENLKKICTPRELSVIKILTRSKDEKYSEYIERVIRSSTARMVKIYDVFDNLQTASFQNKKKYKKVLPSLIEKNPQYIKEYEAHAS